MSKKKLFNIPSISDIREFERKKPGVKSHFQTRSTDTSTVNQDDKASNASPSTLQTSGQTSTIPTGSNTTHSKEVNTRSTNSHGIDVQQPVVQLKKTGSDIATVQKNTESSIGGSGGTLKRKLTEDKQHGETSKDDTHPTKFIVSSSSSSSTSVHPGTSSATSAPGPNKTAAAAAPNSIIVNPRQRGNPLLKHIRNVPWQFGDIVPDYVMGRTVCGLFLSLRYHQLNPNYIHGRLKELGHMYEVRILLVHVDVKDPHHSLKELAHMAILADCTLLLAWSTEEAGRYLETFKAYENKPADSLKEKIDQDRLSKMQECLTTVKSVKKNDVVTLLTTFGTLDKIMASSKEDLSLIPGFGSLKAQRLHSSFHEPFMKHRSTTQEK